CVALRHRIADLVRHPLESVGIATLQGSTVAAVGTRNVATAVTLALLRVALSRLATHLDDLKTVATGRTSLQHRWIVGIATELSRRTCWGVALRPRLGVINQIFQRLRAQEFCFTGVQ